MKFKKTLLALVAATTIAAPIAAVVSCGTTEVKTPLASDAKLVVGYKPDLDPLLALGAPISETPLAKGDAKGFVDGNTNKNIASYQAQINSIRAGKSLWDDDNMDEEYWRARENGKKYVLAPEQWIKTPQKDFINEDPIVHGAYMDYNNGVSGEVYNMAIEGGGVMKLENKTTHNYDDPKNIWQIRSMDEILRGDAASLDSAYEGTDYAAQAEKVINVTDNHWNQFNKLRKNGTSDDFTNDSSKIYPKANDQEETLLVLSLADGAKTMADVSVSTPSELREAYVKGQFAMPTFTAEQASTIEHETHWVKDASSAGSAQNYKAITSSRAGNGIAITGDESAPLSENFWAAWAGKIDKIVIGIPKADAATPALKTAFWSKHAAIKTDISKLLKGNGTDQWKSQTVSMNSNIAGTSSYWFRMPFGQNAFIDNMVNAWYSTSADADAATTWSFKN